MDDVKMKKAQKYAKQNDDHKSVIINSKHQMSKSLKNPS